VNINDLFPLFASLVGAPALIAALVNIAKTFQWVPDTEAPKYVFWANIVVFVGVGVAYFTGNLPLLSQIDVQLGSFATFLLTLVAFVTELGLAKVYHVGLRGYPAIGKSRTYDESVEYG
jgi:hypothetical protein